MNVPPVWLTLMALLGPAGDGPEFDPFTEMMKKTKEYQVGYREGRAEADRELEQGRATLYVYGHRLSFDNLDPETGLPYNAVAGCRIDSVIVGRADGHDDRIKESIAAHGLPANSFKRWMKELRDLKGYVASRLEAGPAISLEVGGRPARSPDGKHSVRAAKMTEKSVVDGKPREYVVLVVDDGRVSDRPVTLIGFEGEPRLLWGPGGSGFAVVLYKGLGGEQAEAIDLHRGWWLRMETLSPDKP